MKPLFVISCPIDTYSGYGARSRDLVKAVINLDKYEVKIIPQRWGNTPWGFIEEHKESWGFLQSYLLVGQQLHKQPEVWMQITVPNEFQPIGRYNIGVTAGIETTICDPSWIEGLNRMNLNLVSSEHAKTVFLNSKFEQRDQRTNQILGLLQATKPIEVLYEGAHLDVYKTLEWDSSVNTLSKLDDIEEDFCYLTVGHWMQGDVGEDRKNIGLTVKAFYETFKNQSSKPALVLKTAGAGSSYMDRDSILHKLHQIRQSVNSTDLPKIYLLHGEFSDEDVNVLYNHPKIKAMVSLTKGEGFGRPLLEFSLMKKPIIATNWSGHIDFLDKESTILLDGTLTQLHPSAAVPNMLLQESQWFSVDTQQVGFYLRDVFQNYDKYLSKAKRQYHRSKTKFSFEAMQTDLGYILDRNIPEFPKPLQLKLPQLKKIELPKLKKVEADANG
jgi:hypothetical protein